MKILGIILAVLMLTGSALVGVLGSNKARDAASMISQVEELAGARGGKKAAAVMGELPSSGKLKFGSIVGLLGAAAAAALLVMTFAKKNLVLYAAGAAVGLALISAVIYPHVPTGPTDGLAPRPQALLAAGLAAVGALGAWLASRKPAGATQPTGITAAA
jgi:hypothetical protein